MEEKRLTPCLQLEADLALLAEMVDALPGMATRLTHLKTIDDISQNEIEHHKRPEGTHLKEDIAERASHRIQACISPDTEGAGEEPGDTLPIAWDG